ncbi:bromo adjacent homology domain-containing 1 protein [Hippocampus zosterae]|uniref:bromo adjacent homology domain-containing 1 protein n=1 Tax=Hippocampus zosterae TaxID=109293 RepID=UPI00223CBEDA|nr:bromo adjacent homology domain-containing 1 protein [Hippocampus zosterae]
MTHTSQKGSRRDRSPLQPRGRNMGGEQAERALRYGRTKKIGEVIRREKNNKAMKDKRANKDEEKKSDRKLYPLRGRLGEGFSCRVLLTRLEESIRKKAEERSLRAKSRKGKLGKPKLASKVKSKLVRAHVSQPRKRRLASLNAEAVNTLLLERPTDLQLAAKLAKRHQGEPINGSGSLDVVAPKPSRGMVSNPSCSHKFDQISKKVKKARPTRVDKKRAMSLEILDVPTPRRLAGLNAAALLKLTSLSAVSKQRVKTTTTTTTTSDCKTPSQIQTQKQPSRVKHKERPQKQKEAPTKVSPMHCCCAACKDKADFEPKVDWESGNHVLAKPGYQFRSMLSYSLKNVKEEQLETELSPCYCCPPEGSMEYCHRLAFFLGHPESGNRGGTPVKRECLVTTPSLTHSHPALTLSPHPCLCYYVHIAPHPPPPHAATSATLAPRPLNFVPPALCPNRMMGSKLLPGPRVAHASGIPHPACCNSVASPCYGDTCGMGNYTCRAVPTVASRGCSFNVGCTGCSHGIKTETYSSPQGDHNPSILVPPSLPLSNCPLSSMPTSTQTTNPHPLNPLSDHEQHQVPRRAWLKAAANLSGISNGDQSAGPRPQQQRRIGRRRATNGWRPVGVSTEKEVFIAGEDETALRQCYEGVERDGEVIRVRDTVLLRSGPRKKSLPYVAKISALWEDPKTGELMMSLFWYYRPEHTQGGRDPSVHCENEIFASRHQDENSVACIEDRCYVLPLAQYCRYCALMKRRSEGARPSAGISSVVPCCQDFAPPSHRCVPTDVDPELVYLCRHVYDFRYGRMLKNLQ